jgi:DNA transformation protein
MEEKTVQLTQLDNLGPKSRAWLNEIGIFTLGDLEEIGPVEAYRQIKARGHNATLNLVYGIQGAIIGAPWNHLPLDMRERLRREVKELNERSQNERS